MGTGIMDAAGELASSGAGIPAFVGVLDKAVKVVLGKFKPADIRPGDVFATNDPYYGGVTHLNDIVVAMPVFAGGQVIAWTANIAHNSDVGGMAPGSLSGDATEIFQEGLRLPAIKIIAEGEPICLGHGHHHGQFADARHPGGRPVGRHRLGPNRRAALAGTGGEIRRGDLWRMLSPPSWITAKTISRRALADLPKGTFKLTEEQDDGRFFNVDDHDHRQGVHRRSSATTPTSRQAR